VPATQALFGMGLAEACLGVPNFSSRRDARHIPIGKAFCELMTLVVMVVLEFGESHPFTSTGR